MLHLHLCVELVKEHLPLILVAHTVDHSCDTHRLLGAIVEGGHHMEHLRHNPTAEQSRIRHRALLDDKLEERVIVIEDCELAIFV